MKWNKKGAAAVLALALLLVGGASIRPALAYFTTYTETSGGRTLALAPDTELIEEAEGMEKYIRIENTGNAPVWVRAKLFYPDGWEVGREIVWTDGAPEKEEEDSTEQGGKWTYGSDGWWYYSEKLPAGMLTGILHVTINPPEGYKGDFDVIVVYEYTAEDDADGNADWTAKTDAGDSEEEETAETGGSAGNQADKTKRMGAPDTGAAT